MAGLSRLPFSTNEEGDDKWHCLELSRTKIEVPAARIAMGCC
jgi:hypothetical protein